MKKYPGSSGFTTVELLITLFIAALFLTSAFQLYNVVITSSNESRQKSTADSIAYDALRRYSGQATDPCTVVTPAPAPTVPNGTKLDNATLSVTFSCPYGTASSVTKIETNLSYGNPVTTTKHATMVDMGVDAMTASIPISLATVAAGDVHSVAIDGTGHVYAWGDNSNGQLGDGTTTQRTTPVAVNTSGALNGKTVKAVAAGWLNSMALTTDGLIFSWGKNDYGQLGDSTLTQRNAPVPVDTTNSLAGKTVVDIAAGGTHSLAISNDGKVHAWGHGTNGQLGNGTATDTNYTIAVNGTGFIDGKKAVDIAGGGAFSLALTSEGKVFAWGDNSNGQLGDGTTTQRNTPVAVDTSGALNGKTIKQIAAGEYHAMALDNDGWVFTWGSNSNGQLGDGTTTQRTTPVAVKTSGALNGKVIAEIAAGDYFSLALDTNGIVYAWGQNTYGQLGDSSNNQRTTAVAVNTSGALNGKVVSEIAGGWSHSLTLVTANEAYAWGYNSNGQLGDGTTTNRTVPVGTAAPF